MHHFFIRCSFPLFLLLLLFFISCSGNIITETDIIILEDTINPEITIFAPFNTGIGYYPSTVKVEGQVSDLANEDGLPGMIDSLRYQVIGTARGGNIQFDVNGFFSFSFYAGDFEGEKTLSITGSDWNGNIENELITLNKGSFHNLTCIPGNKEITLNWDIAPHVQSYTLYYTDNGTTPTITNSIYVDNITSPHTMAGLTNGLLYSILIKGNTGEEVDDWSDVVQTIPLSPFTLAPKVRGEYDEIHVEWNGIPGAQGYTILRSSEKTGQFTPLSGLYTDTFFTDHDVTPGEHYYYKIRPTNGSCIESEAIYGETSPFPPLGSKTGSCNTHSFAYSVAVKDSYAYVADYTGLTIVNITDPSSPQFVKHYTITGHALDVSVSGNYAYIAADNGGLCIVNIINPADPSFIPAFPTSGYASAVEVKDGFAYVMTTNVGLQIIDISDPADPQPEGFCDLAVDGQGMTINGNYAYIAGGNAGLFIVDVTNPSQPQHAGSFNTPHIAYDVAVAGSYAYVADDTSGLQILDISTLSEISIVSSYDRPGPGGARGIELSGIYAYVANDSGGVFILNISDPAHPVQVATYDAAAYAKGITIKDQYAFVAAYNEGLHIISSAEPGSLTHAYTIGTTAEAKSITMDGNYAYIAASTQGLLVYEINHHETPTFIDSYTTSGNVLDVSVCGNFAFITGYNTGLEIVDISDPGDCEYVSICDIPGSSTGAEPCGDYIYVSYWEGSGESGIKIYDIADPWNPGPVTSYPAGDYARDINVSGGYAYIAEYEAGMRIVNIAELISSPPVGTCDTNGNATGVKVWNNYAFIADGYAGIKVIDISRELSPLPYGEYKIPGLAYAYHIDNCGYYLFIAYGSNGLTIIDYRQPDNILFAGGYDMQDALTQAITIQGSYAYVAAGNSVQIFDLWPYDDP